jgi:hypothetical protein
MAYASHAAAVALRLRFARRTQLGVLSNSLPEHAEPKTALGVCTHPIGIVRSGIGILNVPFRSVETRIGIIAGDDAPRQ